MFGELVNFDKSLISFGENVEDVNQVQIGQILGVRISTNPEKYLGFPLMVGRWKKMSL